MRDEFGYPCHPATQAEANALGSLFSVFLDDLEQLIQNLAMNHRVVGNVERKAPREMALVRTKLQEACYFARLAVRDVMEGG